MGLRNMMFVAGASVAALSLAALGACSEDSAPPLQNPTSASGNQGGGNNNGGNNNGGNNSGGDPTQGGGGSGEGGQGGSGPLHGCDTGNTVDLTGETTVVLADTGEWNTSFNGNVERKCIVVDEGTSVTWAGNFTDHPLRGGAEPVIDNGSPITVAGEPVTGDGTVEVTFEDEGDYPYFCNAHPGLMNGVVVVVDPGCIENTAVYVGGGGTVTVAASGEWNTAFNNNVVNRCLMVDTGTTVEWVGNFTNHPLVGGDQPIADGGSPISIAADGVMGAATVSLMLSATGQFPYFCDKHPSSMSGRIFVVDP